MPPEAERGGARTAGEDRGSLPTNADAGRQAKGREQTLPGPQRGLRGGEISCVLLWAAPHSATRTPIQASDRSDPAQAEPGRLLFLC